MQEQIRKTRVLIVYYSRFGAITSLAEQVAEGACRVPNIETDFLKVEDLPVEALRPDEREHDMQMRRATVVGKLGSADAFVIGAPAYFGSMASPVKRLFEDCATASSPPATDRSRPWRHYLFRDKPGGAFTTSATMHGGNEQALHSILTMLMHLGMVVITPGQQMPILENDAAPYGATAVTGAGGNRIPTQSELEGASALGQRVAEVAIWLSWGHTEWEKRYGAIADLSSSVSTRKPVAVVPTEQHQ